MLWTIAATIYVIWFWSSWCMLYYNHAGSGDCCFVENNNETSFLHNSGSVFWLIFLSTIILILNTDQIFSSLVDPIKILTNELSCSSGWHMHIYYHTGGWFFPLLCPFSSFMQWEALALLLIGISVNQLRSLPDGASSVGLPVATVAYIFTGIFVSSSFWCIVSTY